jgi:hypothetical protein
MKGKEGRLLRADERLRRIEFMPGGVVVLGWGGWMTCVNLMLYWSL